MISNNQPSSSRTAVDANTTQSSQRTITHDAEDDLASDDKRELTREMMIVAESEATVAEKKDDDDNCLEMNGIQFLKLHKGLLTISRYIDIIDKCQGRELSFFHINGLIEQIVNSKTDMHHGGQFLHVFWNLSKLLSRIRDLQMNIEFLFFEQDEVYTWLDVMEIDRMKTQEGLKSMTYSISEGVEILEQSIYRDDYMVSVKLPLSKVESPKWKPLLKELLRMYLSNNGFVCHTFKNMCDAKFLQLLRQREPGFILAQRNDHLFKSLCIFVGRFVGDSLNFGSNTCYSYVSGTSFSSTLECPCFVDVMDKIQEQGNAALSEKKHTENNYIDDRTFQEIDERLNKYSYLETYQRDKLFILLLTVRRIQDKISDSTLDHLFSSVLLLSALIAFNLDLDDRAFQLPSDDEFSSLQIILSF